MTDQTMFYFIPGIFLFVGFLFCCVAAGMNMSLKKKHKTCTAQTVGTVKDLRRVHQRDTDNVDFYTWNAVFSYYANGTQYEKLSSFGTSRKKFKVGQSVIIFYDPANPKSFYAPAENRPGLIKAFWIAGALSILAGIVALYILLRIAL